MVSSSSLIHHIKYVYPIRMSTTNGHFFIVSPVGYISTVPQNNQYFYATLSGRNDEENFSTASGGGMANILIAAYGSVMIL